MRIRADVLHIRMPTVEVFADTYRIVTCGTWSLSVVDNASAPSYLKDAAAVEVRRGYDLFTSVFTTVFTRSLPPLPTSSLVLLSVY